MGETTQLLKKLTEAHGIPGYEAPVRGLVRELMEPLGDLSQDKMGSVICRKAGSAEAPKVMLAGHMDEIGLMIKYITAEGFLKFLPLGGWFDQVLLGQRVIIKTSKGDVPGVVGAKPPHLLSADERSKMMPKKEMYIDIGASSKEEVEVAGVRPGDPAIPMADFVELAGGKTFMSKAFDDRVGVAMMISAMQILLAEKHPNTVYGAATVQEEIGLRGANTAVHAVDPDVAIVLESDIAGDVPGITVDQSSVKLGLGPTVLIYDSRMVPNLKLRDLVIETAEKEGVPLQLSYIESGSTDGGAIHIYKTGVPTVVISVPMRHMHSDSSIIHRDDFENAVKLLVAVLQRLDADAVTALTA